MAETLSQRCTTPASPGVDLFEDGARFCVFSRHAENVSICLFDGERETQRLRLHRDGEFFAGFVPGVGPGRRYGLRADGPWDPRRGHRFDPDKLLVDPFATRLDRAFAYDALLAAPRGHGGDTAALVPKAVIERPVITRSETTKATPRLVYEVCVKAHTKLDPGVPLDLRGTLRGLAQPHVVERFVKLGVSHVELMPIAAWIDERHLPPLGLTNAWGYNPVALSAPDPRLAPNGLADLADVCAALRSSGIGVVLDVVYNHTGESDAHGPTLSLRGLDNAVYYRHDGGGAFINDAGCGNILACDEPAVVQLVTGALRNFARAGVAGFRFDLAATLGRRATGFDRDAPLLQAITDDPALRALELIAEPWDVGPGGYRLGAFRAPWREWNDRFRDDVRRFWRGDAGAAGALATRLCGSADVFAHDGRTPSASVNFVAAHDGFALRDLVSYAHKNNWKNGEHNRDGNDGEIAWNCGVEGETDDAAANARRAADVRALLATLLLSRGTPMLTAGDEFGRTQGGNNNAYAQDNATTWLDWIAADRKLAEFVAALAALRAKTPTLCEDRFLTGRIEGEAPCPDAVWTRADGGIMADHDWRDTDFVGLTLTPVLTPGARAHLAFNRGGETPLRLPDAAAGKSWRLVLDSRRGFVGEAPAHDVVAPARSVLAFVEA
jgi:glycogen operon protein